MKASDVLRQDKAAKVDELRSLAEATKSRAMKPDERSKFDALKSDIEALKVRIEDADYIEREDYAQAERQHRASHHGREPQPVQAKVTPFAGFARALYKGDAKRIDEKNGGDFMERRTLTSTTTAGAIQNPLVADEIIFNSLSGSYIEQLGVDMFGLRANYYQLPQVTAYPTAAPYTEAQPIPTGDPTIGAVKFEAKNYGLLVKVHNNVLRDAGPRTDAIIQGVIDRAIQDAFLKAMLYGTTTNGGFVGLDGIAGLGTVDAASAILDDYTTFTTAAQKAMTANAMLDKIGYLMHPAVWEQLQDAADTTGQPLVMPSGLIGRPMAVSTAVKKDYGTSPDFLTRVYAGDFSTVKLGIEGRYEMFLDQTFAADDVSAFAIVVRADLKVFEPAKLVRIENIGLA